MPHRIALIAPPWYPVPPVGYGGIELVVALLARELRTMGDEVSLIGAEGSRLASHTLAPRTWSTTLGTSQERLRELTYAVRVLEAMQTLRVDVVHDHCGMSALLAVVGASRGVPVVHTVHGLISEADREYYAALRHRAGLVALSEAQRSTAPTLPWAATIHNAVDIEALVVGRRDEREPYLFCLARICPDKGQHLAIEAARRAGMRLVLAGKVEETARGHEYFQRYVAPVLDGDRVVHLPNVAGRDKARLLAHARALVAPLQWEEPFGLALAEAMASGTPVIAFPRGAAPELVEPGVTGFLVPDVDGLVEAVGWSGDIDPERCAREARQRFDPAAMARAYRAVYEARAVEPVDAVEAGWPLLGEAARSGFDAHLIAAAGDPGRRPRDHAESAG